MNRSAAIEALMMTGARIAFVGFWFVAMLLIYRGLGSDAQGLAQAGLFAFAIALIKTASGVVSDPVDLAVMRRAPAMLRDAPLRAFEIIRAAFVLRLGAAMLLAGAVAAFADLVALHWLGNPDAARVLRFVSVAILCEMLFRAALVVLQAQERFGTFVLFEGLLSLGRFLAIVLLWATGHMEVEYVLASYVAAALIAALTAPFLMPLALLTSLSFPRQDLRDHVAYLKWMMPAMLLAAANERLDIFLVVSLTGPENAGLYGAALTLAMVPDIVAGCLSTLLQPRIVALQARGDFPQLMRRFLMVSLPVCGAGFILALLLAEPVLGLVLGPRYGPAVPAFLWLLAGTLFWLAVTPLPITLVAVTAPRRIALITLAQSCIVLIGGLVLIPLMGWIGMAQAVCAMRILVALAVVFAAGSLADATPSRNAAALSGAAPP